MTRFGGGTLGLRTLGEEVPPFPLSVISRILSPTNSRSVESSSIPRPNHLPHGKLKALL